MEKKRYIQWLLASAFLAFNIAWACETVDTLEGSCSSHEAAVAPSCTGVQCIPSFDQFCMSVTPQIPNGFESCTTVYVDSVCTPYEDTVTAAGTECTSPRAWGTPETLQYACNRSYVEGDTCYSSAE